MGHRTMLAIREKGELRLHYDHWVAPQLDAELFWGPDLARAFIESCAQPEDGGWLDEVWCEGAVLMDLDARDLLWFGGSEVLYDVFDRRAHLALMRRQWPGWTMRWASGGVSQIGVAAGLPEHALLSDLEPRGDIGTGADAVRQGDMLLTWIEGGAGFARRVYGGFDRMRRGLAILRPGLDAARADPPAQRLDDGPDNIANGAHLDFDAKRLAYWSASPCDAAESRLRTAWPDWRVEWLEDRLEEHLAMSPIPIPPPDIDEAMLIEKRIERLRTETDREGRNLALALTREDPSIQLNPATFAAQGSVGDPAWKRALLDTLEAEVDRF